MAAGNQHIADTEQFRRYLRGELSYDEQHLFEKRLMEDALFRDAYDGFLLMDSDGVNPGPALTSLDDALQQRVNQRTWRMGAVWVYATAASIVLAVSWFAFFNRSKEIVGPQSTQVIAVQKAPEKTSRPTVADRSADSAVLAQAKSRRAISAKKEHKGNLLAGRVVNKEEHLALNTPRSLELNESVLAAPESSVPSSQSEIAPNTYESLRPSLFKSSRKMAFPDSGRLVLENNQIRGRVVDSSGQSIPGVTIRAFKSYAVTDSSGSFSMPKPSADSMSLSYIGYKNKIVKIDKMNLGAIQLEEDRKMLNEVVVIGYGSQKKKVSVLYKQVKPRPAGGWPSYRRYLHQKAPGQITGKVKVTFMVRPDGSLSGLFATGDPELTKAAVEVVQNGPSWQPTAGENPRTDSGPVTVTVNFYK